MKKIPLTKGFETLVDDEDYERLSVFKWYAHGAGSHWYAARNLNHKQLFMHHVLRPVMKPFMTDHIDGNGCNNQKSNLRVVLRSQNGMNSKVCSDSKTGFKGVTKRRKTWKATIGSGGSFHYLGTFNDPIEAAKAYDAAAEFHYGEFARTNKMMGLIP